MRFGMSGWHAFVSKVLVLMAVRTLERIEAFAVGVSLHVLKMRMTVFALQWSVSSGMAIHATRMHEYRSEEHTSELQSRPHLVCRLLLEKKRLDYQDPAHQSISRLLSTVPRVPSSKRCR